jgi:pimeloyl-ACP methyl ester carboxylesterase
MLGGLCNTGAMISCKLAAMAPHRICSLALLNVTGGGFQCFPKVPEWRILLVYTWNFADLAGLSTLISSVVLINEACLHLQLDGQMLSLAFRFLRARTPEERALVDLETHYTKVKMHPFVICQLM